MGASDTRLFLEGVALRNWEDEDGARDLREGGTRDLRILLLRGLASAVLLPLTVFSLVVLPATRGIMLLRPLLTGRRAVLLLEREASDGLLVGGLRPVARVWRRLFTMVEKVV